jgi:hypothetical protein
MNIIRALDDKELFGAVLRNPATWNAWRAFLCALFALPMSEAEAALYRECTGRSALPVAGFIESAGALASRSCWRSWPCSSPASEALLGIWHQASARRSW